MDLLNETGLLKTKSTLLNLLIRETSQFLCYERLLNMTYVAYKNAFFREMQFWSHCYTVVPYQALFRLSVYKIPAVYLSVQKMCVFARYATLVPRLRRIYPSLVLVQPRKTHPFITDRLLTGCKETNQTSTQKTNKFLLSGVLPILCNDCQYDILVKVQGQINVIQAVRLQMPTPHTS